MTPNVYIIRVAEDQWFILPFDQNVAQNKKGAASTSLETTIEAVQNLAVSLVLSSCGSSVRWMLGADITPDLMLSQEY
jgi:hypothetical protein